MQYEKLTPREIIYIKANKAKVWIVTIFEAIVIFYFVYNYGLSGALFAFIVLSITIWVMCLMSNMLEKMDEEGKKLVAKADDIQNKLEDLLDEIDKTK